MAEVKIAAEVRTDFGKGAARRTRREDKVPGVIYGHGGEPEHVDAPEPRADDGPEDLERPDQPGRRRQGRSWSSRRPCSVRPSAASWSTSTSWPSARARRSPSRSRSTPRATWRRARNLLEHVLNTLPVEAEATHIPESVTVSVEGLEAGASILAKDIALPKGSSLAVEDDAVVLQVVAAQAEESGRGGRRGRADEAAEA